MSLREGSTLMKLLSLLQFAAKIINYMKTFSCYYFISSFQKDESLFRKVIHTLTKVDGDVKLHLDDFLSYFPEITFQKKKSSSNEILILW